MAITTTLSYPKQMAEGTTTTQAAAVPSDQAAGSDSMTDAELAGVVRMAVLRAARKMRTQRVNTAVTLSQLSALATVDKSGPMSAGEVAAIEQVQPPSMTKILAALETSGLITRSARPDDRRQSVIAISPAGAELLEAETRIREEWLALQLAKLPAVDREKLLLASEVLERLGS
jgi:DNA-binding MarR family transcriptional regulator